MSYDGIFEDCFFNKISKCVKSKNHNAFSSDDIKFEDEVSKNLLNFASLQNRDKKVKIIQTRLGYNIKLSKPHLAFDLKSILSEVNSGINLEYAEDYLDYEPDDDLIMKSKIPLWVMKPMDGGNTVAIQRVW